jgi:hypothetical protein
VNYQSILAGRRPDVVLRDNDTLYLKPALF